MAIYNVSQKIALMTRFPESVFYSRDFSALATISGIAGRATSLWLMGGNPGNGVAPGAVAAPTSATAGAIPFTNATGGRSKYIVQVAGSCSGFDTLTVFFDRLLHISGLSGTSTGVQTVGGSLTRYTDGVGNWIGIEIYTAIGATARNLTVNYTNQAGAAKSVVVVIGATGLLEIGRFVVCPLATGDTGVQSVTSVQLDVSTGTAGNFGVTVGHTLASLPGSLAGSSERNFVGDGSAGILVPPSACIAAYMVPSSAISIAAAPTANLDYGLHMVEA